MWAKKCRTKRRSCPNYLSVKKDVVTGFGRTVATPLCRIEIGLGDKYVFSNHNRFNRYAAGLDPEQ